MHETVEVQCESCGVHLSVEEGMRTATCPYCDSPYVVERPVSPDRPDPEFTLAFVVDRERAVETVRGWASSSGLFVHSGVKSAPVEKTRGVYLPAYLYGAVAESDYSAQIGENYQTTETYTTTDGKGNTVVRTRTVTKTEWRDLSGHHTGYVMDVIVTASAGLPNQELEHIEPFDLRALRRYAPELVIGWPTEEPSLGEDTCLQHAHDESIREIGNRLGGFMPGDSYRELRHHTTLREEVTDLVLLPIWVFALRYDPEKPPIRVLVNGQTGEVWGKAPLSVWKITLAIVLGLVMIAVIVLVLGAA